jgi:dipicolinate synthase subunit A
MVGGDKRNIALAKMLHAHGHTVKLYGFANYEIPSRYDDLDEAVKDADCIIGPVPCSHDGHTFNAPLHNASLRAEALFERLQPHQLFLAGVIKPEILRLADEHLVPVVDMLKREELLVRNAIPTAEGALKIAIEETDITLHGNQMLIIGYGRIGKVLASMLRGMGAYVTVAVHKSEAAALAESNGHRPVFSLESALPYADIIFNTVPSILLNRDNMHLIQKDALIIDLASPPYGVEKNDNREFGLRVLYTNSLPGKIAPITTASYMLDTVYHVLSERENGGLP